MISDVFIPEILQLDDAEGVVCLLNEEIFADLAQMGYKKPAKRTSWNEFSTAMASAENVVEDVANDAIPSPPSHDIPSPSQEQSLPPQQPQSSPQAPPQGAKFPTHLFQQLVIIKLKARVKRLERANKVKSSKLRHLKKVGASKRIESSDVIEDIFNQGRMINDLDKDKGIELVVDQAEIYHLDLDHPSKVLISAASATIFAAKLSIHAAALTVVDACTRRRKGVIIRDPEEELSSKTPAETPKLKDKGKGILIETPKPMKKKDQIELDAEYARKLHEEINNDHEEINKDIDWDAAIDHVKQKSKNPQYIKRYQVIKKRPQTETRFDANMRFLFKSREEIEEEDQEHLEVVYDEDDDVFTKATPLARKVPVVDYQIVLINNKPRFKIIKADETHQLYSSFITLLKNFDREDLENLWGIVKERFLTSKPSNFFDEYLLTTLKTMFEKPGGQDAVWKSQRSIHGLALVKSWKMLTSCGVHIITLLTIQLILLVERRYPLSKFTLEQLVNVTRLQVEEETDRRVSATNVDILMLLGFEQSISAVRTILMLLEDVSTVNAARDDFSTAAWAYKDVRTVCPLCCWYCLHMKAFTCSSTIGTRKVLLEQDKVCAARMSFYCQFHLRSGLMLLVMSDIG
nr:hypothetical protein [Tanacetum cinerariifolium]